MGRLKVDADQRRKSSVLVTVTAASFMTPLMISGVNIALPAIQKEFSVSAVLLGWIATAYLLTTGAALMPAGKVADIYGRKKIFATGIFLFTMFTVATAFAPSVFWIILCRSLQGVGGAMVMTTGIAILTSVFPLSERGKAIGIAVAAVYLGLSVGPFAGGILTTVFGWRSVFLASGPLGVLAFVLAVTRIEGEWTGAKGDPLDIAGSVLYALALIGVVYGLSKLPTRAGFVILAAGLAGLGGFAWYELRIPYPVFEVRLFAASRTFAFSSLAALINYAATFAVSFLLSLYLQYIKGMGPEQAGLVLICQPAMQALFSPVAGKMSDRVEPAVIASVGMALTAGGLILLIFLGTTTGTSYILCSLVVLGIGFALFSSPNMNAIMSSVENEYHGIASGAVSTMRLIGQLLSMALATLVFHLLLGHAQITPANYGAFLRAVNTAFALFSALCLGGIYFSAARGTVRQQRNATQKDGDGRR
jgi:MFS family permease